MTTKPIRVRQSFAEYSGEFYHIFVRGELYAAVPASRLSKWLSHAMTHVAGTLNRVQTSE